MNYLFHCLIGGNNCVICFSQEVDRKILEALAEKESELAKVQTARREKARADASWMKKVTLYTCTG